MKKFLIVFVFLIGSQQLQAWGPIGHRVIGLIAERHLTKKARKKIDLVLRKETLAEVSTFMDFIRADDRYEHMDPWHYMTIPDNQSYEQVGPPSEGDVYVTIKRLISELQTKNFTDEDEAFALKCLVHLVGDVHQPLHVGNGEDRGGNDVKLRFMYRDSNLHRVWDSGMIDQQKYSYTEYADWIDFVSKSFVADCQASEIMDWILESKALRADAYELPEDKNLGYAYTYLHIEQVNRRLLQAGVRLAGILNNIYG